VAGAASIWAATGEPSTTITHNEINNASALLFGILIFGILESGFPWVRLLLLHHRTMTIF
jgi:hypothetical protein